MAERLIKTIEDFSIGYISSSATENLPDTSSSDARNLNIRDRGQAVSSNGWVPIENIGLLGRIMHTGDFHPTDNERFSPSVIVPDTGDAAIFDLSNQWVKLNNSQITARSGFVFRVASGTIADSASGAVIERSTDGGNTFSTTNTYSNTTGESQTINGGVIIELATGDIIYSVNLSGSTINVVTTASSTDDGATWGAQTHPNTSDAAPAEELTTTYYQQKNGTNTTRLYVFFTKSGAIEAHFSDDRGASFTIATTNPGGTAQPQQAYEARSGEELSADGSFTSITAGSIYVRNNSSGATRFKTANGGVDWASSTEINFPYGLFFARMDRNGSPGGARTGRFYIIGDGRSRSQLVMGRFARPLGISKPAAKPTLADVGSGRTGTYEINYTYYDTLTTQESAPSEIEQITVADGNIDVTPTASTEINVDRIRFYLRKQATSTTPEFSTALFAGEAGNVASAFSISETDIDILLRNQTVDKTVGGSVVPSFRIFEQHQGRLLMASDVPYDVGSVSVTNGSKTVTGTGPTWHVGMQEKFLQVDGDSRRYFIQAVTSTTSITLSTDFQGTTNTNAGYSIGIDQRVGRYSHVLRPWATKSHLTIPMEVRFGDDITGLKSYSNDLAMWFTEDNVHAMSGTLQSGPSFSITPLVRGVGCISHRGIVQVNDVVFWVSKNGFESWSNFRGYRRISEDRVDADFTGFKFGEDFTFCVVDPIEEEIHIFLTKGTNARVPDTRLRYNYKDDAWMKGDFNGFMTAGVLARTSGDLPEVRFMYYDETDSRPMSLSRTVAAEGPATGTISGTVQSATAGDPVTLTIDDGTLDTTDDALQGRFLTMQQASSGDTQSIRIASNTGTVITGEAGIAFPTFVPVNGDRWSIGGIDSRWKTPALVLGSQEGITLTEVHVAFEIV